jgi:hypothetical protein
MKEGARVLLVGVLGAVLPASAHAREVFCASRHEGPCKLPEAWDVLLGGDAPAVVMNFGLLVPAEAPGKLALVCEEAFGARVPQRILHDPRDQFFVPALGGVHRGDRLGCAWPLVSGIPTTTQAHDVVIDPAVPTRRLALVQSVSMPYLRTLYVSEDDGGTFTIKHTFSADQRWSQMAAAPGTPGRLYVAGFGAANLFALARSDDGGATFATTDPVPMLAERNRGTLMLGVSPLDGNRVFFARDRPDFGDDVWVSTDAGQSARRVLALPGGEIVQGFTFGDGNTVFVAGRVLLAGSPGASANLYVSRDGGDTWLPALSSGPTGPRYRCLRFAAGKLFACGAGETGMDDFLVGSSSDEGRTWTPVYRLSDLLGPRACSTPLCRDTVAWLCETYGICGTDGLPVEAGPDGGVEDAGRDATTDASPGVGGGGCGCRVGDPRGGRTGVFFVPLASLGALLGRALFSPRRRRRG